MIISLGLFVSGCGNDGGKEKASGEKNIDKVMKVGFHADFAPFEFKDVSKNTYSGFDVDLITAILKEMGYKPEFCDIEFDKLLDGLEAGKVDLVISGMGITDERRKRVNFSEPYYKTGLTLVVNAKTERIKSFDDLSGMIVAVQRGSTSGEQVKMLKGVVVKETNSASEALVELVKGNVDAVANDRASNEYYVAKNGFVDLKILNERMKPEDCAIAVRKKDKELLKKINEILVRLKRNGEYDKIYKKWFAKRKA